MAYKKTSTYTSKTVDNDGNANYTADENSIWRDLISRQIPIIQERACDEFLNGMHLLQLPTGRIPQCPDVSKVLRATTGWSLASVPALIPFDQFFYLLANKQFPAATFIRRRDELDYLQEPDIFHEVFGHCPLLTNQAYADFTHTYGQLGLNASHEDRVMLAKLYWFTIEFGLIHTKKGLRAYGGGILSSYNESQYCLESPVPLRKPLEVLEVLRTPYRIDIMQPIYFIIDSFDVLFQLIDTDLITFIREAKRLGMHQAMYESA